MASTPSSGINKSLLTPCRRVGLSRKRKTPNSIVKISSDLNSSNSSLNDSPVIDTTPVNHRKSFSRRKHEGLRQLHSSNSPLTILPIDSGSEKQLKTELQTLQECDDNNGSKTYLLNKFSSEDLFESIETMSSTKHVIMGTLEKIVKDNPIEKLKKTFSADETMDNKDSMDEKERSLATSLEVIKTKNCSKSKRRLSDDFLTSEKTSMKTDKANNEPNVSSFNVENDVIDDSDEDFRIVSKCDSKQKQKVEETRHTKRTKRIRKTLSIRKTSLSSSDDEFDTDILKTVITNDNVKECQVQIQRLSEDNICLSETSRNIDKPLKNVVRNTTIIDDDDDDAFTLTPEQEKAEKKNLLQQINVLEYQIRRKQQKFADLKQASVYKNKHDVEGLKKLTSQWVNGCVSGLNDLLGLLQAHGPMNMKTLVNNLHISSEHLAKLPLNIE